MHNVKDWKNTRKVKYDFLISYSFSPLPLSIPSWDPSLEQPREPDKHTAWQEPSLKHTRAETENVLGIRIGSKAQAHFQEI